MITLTEAKAQLSIRHSDGDERIRFYKYREVESLGGLTMDWVEAHDASAKSPCLRGDDSVTSGLTSAGLYIDLTSQSGVAV